MCIIPCPVKASGSKKRGENTSARSATFRKMYAKQQTKVAGGGGGAVGGGGVGVGGRQSIKAEYQAGGKAASGGVAGAERRASTVYARKASVVSNSSDVSNDDYEEVKPDLHVSSHLLDHGYGCGVVGGTFTTVPVISIPPAHPKQSQHAAATEQQQQQQQRGHHQHTSSNVSSRNNHSNGRSSHHHSSTPTSTTMPSSSSTTTSRSGGKQQQQQQQEQQQNATQQQQNHHGSGKHNAADPPITNFFRVSETAFPLCESEQNRREGCVFVQVVVKSNDNL